MEITSNSYLSLSILEIQDKFIDSVDNDAVGGSEKIMEYFNSYRYNFYIKVDDKIYSKDNSDGGPVQNDGRVKGKFKELNYSDIKDAKSVEVMVSKTNYYQYDENGVPEAINESISDEYGNITYIKEIKDHNENIISFSKPEIIDDSTIRFSYTGNVEPLVAFGDIAVWENRGKYNRGIVKKEDDKYILEFNNVNLNNKIDIIGYISTADLNTSKIIGTVKIK